MAGEDKGLKIPTVGKGQQKKATGRNLLNTRERRMHYSNGQNGGWGFPAERSAEVSSPRRREGKRGKASVSGLKKKRVPACNP